MHRMGKRASFLRRQECATPLRALDRTGAAAEPPKTRPTKAQNPKPHPYNCPMQTATKNPLIWLLLFLTAWACLAAPPCGAKTASGNFYGPESASSKTTGWKAAPRLGFGDLAAESASVPLVGANTAADQTVSLFGFRGAGSTSVC